MKVRPTRKQLDFLSWEVGMFFHFGIRTFNHGHEDWDGREMAAETFDPKMLDCRQWMRAAKLIGAKYAIMTAKHHDGFALWPTKTSPYSVAASAWKNGKGDVVREFTDACRAEGLKVGLYYSPAQWGSYAVAFQNEKEYDDYFINQISELLSNYGKIDYLWFDGCGSEGHVYDKHRIIKAIRSLQPDILLFGMWDPDTGWAGNESGYASLPNLYERDRVVLGENKHIFLPLECDCRLRENWFYELDENSIKSVDELIGMYEMSVGRGSNLLLNVGPDDNGLISRPDMRRLTQFRAELDARYGCPLAFEQPEKLEDGSYILSYSRETRRLIGSHVDLPLVRSVVLSEDLTEGQSVKRFRLYAQTPTLAINNDNFYCLYVGETIGHKTICRFPAIRTSRFRLVIEESEGEAVISDMKAY